MTYPPHLRVKAREMRRERGFTIDEIAERLAVSRTTVFYWVGDMPRPQRCLDRPGPAHRLGSRAMQAKYRALREEAYADGLARFEDLAPRGGFLEFVTLFIAEGYKRNRNVVAVGNSDPAVIAFVDRWIRELTIKRITYYVQYHADQDLGELRRFWAELLAVDTTQIKLQRKSNSNQLAKRTWRSEHGVLTVRVNDTYLRARLQAWMDQVRKGWLDSASIGA